MVDPRAHVPMGLGFGWGKDLPVGAGWFQPLFVADGIGDTNPSLLGATPAQLQSWGYSVPSVPSVDDRVKLCMGRRGAAQKACWAEVDQYLMNEVVTWIPYVSLEHTQVVSERVVGYSFDQLSSLPALDRIALAPGSG